MEGARLAIRTGFAGGQQFGIEQIRDVIQNEVVRDPAEMRLFEQMAENLALILNRIDTEAALGRNDTALRFSGRPR